MRGYDHKKIEKKWQAVWTKKKIYQTNDNSKKPKAYILDMFPYPSGEGLHVGHPKGYIATDVISRMKRMQGYNVLHPMGFDAFGLPAENFALKNKIHPEVAVKKNIKRFKEQLGLIGLDYDWSREVITTDPKYYKWTQWIFLQLFKKGLAYESHEPINWCPSCKTGLANEDLEGGRCERCGTVVEKKPLRQWVLKITDYADRLLKDLDLLKDWPEPIVEMQRNWIGRSEGAEISFKVKSEKLKEGIKVFTTRPDTLFGATYLVLAPEHKLVESLKSKVKNRKEVEKYINLAKNKVEIERTAESKEKTGVELKGIKAINPATQEEISIWIADYVFANYGTGAIMAVPAHDERDFQFAKKYNLPIKQVVSHIVHNSEGPYAVKEGIPFKNRNAVMCIVKHWEKDEYLCQEWKDFSEVRTLISGGIEPGENIIDAGKREIKEESGYKNAKFIKQLGGFSYIEFYHQRKKVNTRARFQYLYFQLENGEQEKISEEENNQHQFVWKKPSEVVDFLNISEKERIWDLFKGNEDVFTGIGYMVNSGKFDGMDSQKAKKEIVKFVGGKEKVTYKLRDWVFSRQRYWGEPIPLIHCKDCRVVPVPEKDLPVVLPKVKFYEPTGTGESPLAGIAKWVNVKCPKCKGPAKRETNTMPQWAGSSWYYLRYMDSKNGKALVDTKKEKYWNEVDIYVGGAEHATRHLIYARFWHKFLRDIGIVSTIEPFRRLQSVGLIMGPDGRKMSKRFGNVINPDDIVQRYGADTLRLYEMFMGPFDQAIAWSDESLLGPRRFLEKVWRLASRVQQNLPALPAPLLHKTIKKVSEDIEAMKFNTAISTLMIFVNEVEKNNFQLSTFNFKTFLQLLAPFAPHITEELWQNLRVFARTVFARTVLAKSIHLSDWPKWDPDLIKDEEIKIAVQVNGKVRAEIMIRTDDNEEEVKKKALANQSVLKYTSGKNPKKIIYVKNRLINIVI